MTDSPIPSVTAMLVCDQIITEQITNKKSLIGVFENFNSQSFPVPLSRLAVYVKMADAVGDYQLKLRLVKLKDEALVAEFAVQMTVVDSSKYAELGININNVIIIPEAGKYEFQLYAGDYYLHRVTMQAVLAQSPQTGGGTQWPLPS